MTLREVLQKGDFLLAGSAFLLTVLSLVLLNIGGNNLSFFFRQLFFACIAIPVFLLVSKTHYSLAKSYTPFLFVVLLLLLLFVLQGRVIRGAASWFVLGTLHLQPGEIAKVILVLVLAKVFSDRNKGKMEWKTLLLTIFYVGIPISLILLQPDFGTAMLIILIWFGMIIAAGLTGKQFGALFLLAIVLGIASWLFFLKDYQKQRILIFMNPGADPLGSGYTVNQSITAFGSGGIWGRGLGYGPQSRLNFLPEHRTDFIFARIGEELGFVGVISVFSLYGVMLWRMLYAAQKTSDSFGRAIAIGAFVALLTGVFVNAGMNLGLLPVTGVPLPFISYGGSSMLTMYLLVGLVESVLIHGETWESDDTDGITAQEIGEI